MNKRVSPGRHSSGGFSYTKRRVWSVLVGVLLLMISVAAAAFPFLSNAYYEYYNEREAEEYLQAVERTESTTLQDALELAQAYNAALAEGVELPAAYEDVLNLSGNGLMGYIEIPKLSLSLPICHGTDYDTLQTSVGHLSGTALPVGGIGTHCVLTGHSGLASKRLFSDLDEMEIGDVFYLNILGERLCYEVDDISVILPYELDALSSVPDKDLCTLVTCTPFGINTHRLLIRGVRVEIRDDESNEQIAETPIEDTPVSVVGSTWMRKYIATLLLCFFVTAAVAVGICCIKANNNKRRRRKLNGRKRTR